MRSGPREGRHGSPRLSRRELEVAAFVAQGLTDQEIARRLFLSRRTAEGHVQSIRNKLGLDNRSQVAAWFAREGGAGAAPGPTVRLPVHLTTFLGREAELAGMGELLERARGVTITGPGGVGKTRVATRVAGEMGGRFPGGLWFVDLGAIGDPESVAPAVAAALEVREQESVGPFAAIRSRLGGESRLRCLLLLDNCEHLVDRCARLVAELLGSCPRLTVLSTSREPLLYDGEVVFKLAPLSLPSPDAPAVAVLGSDAGRLFCDRAALSEPAFDLDEAGARTVARLCHELDGMPLALELAGAQVGPLGLEGVLERLGERLDFLRRRSEPARHQTLATAIRWSYDLLDEPARTLFRRLAVFRGGFTEAAARSVAGGVADHLPALAQKSLLMVSGQRWSMLETIRRFAAAVLEESGEAVAARSAHLDHFLELAERAEGELAGSHQAESLGLLEQEHDNLRAALETARVDRPELHRRLVLAIYPSWLLRGHLSEGRSGLEDALGGDAQEPAARARLLNALAGVLWRQGEYESARRHLEESLGLLRALGDERGLQRCLANLGVLAAGQADFESARGYYEESLELARQGGEPLRVAILESNLGVAAAEAGDHDRAQALLGSALTALRALDARAAIGTTLNNLGILNLNRGRANEAAEAYAEALAIFVALGEPPDTAGCLEGLGCVAALEGRPELALRLAGCAEALREALGTPASRAARVRLDQWLPAARRRLGSGAAAAWQAGRGMRAARALELMPPQRTGTTAITTATTAG